MLGDIPVLIVALIALSRQISSVFAGCAGGITPVRIVGKKFYDESGNYIPIIGVDYYPRPNAGVNNENSIDFFTEEHRHIWERDIIQFKALGINAVRLYSVDPSKNHDSFMCALQTAGIYAIIGLASSCEGCAINGFEIPNCYPVGLKNRGQLIINVFSKYDNVIGFSAGNEINHVVPNGNPEMNAPCQKQFIRDMRAHIKRCSSSMRHIPVGVIVADNERELNALYYGCRSDPEDELENAEFFGINVYLHCNAEAKTIDNLAGYKALQSDFRSYNLSIPVLLTEFGCLNPSFPTKNGFEAQRDFLQVEAIHSPLYRDDFAGGFVFEYSTEKVFAEGETPWPFKKFGSWNYGLGYFEPEDCDDIEVVCNYETFPEFETLANVHTSIDTSDVPPMNVFNPIIVGMNKCPTRFDGLELSSIQFPSANQIDLACPPEKEEFVCCQNEVQDCEGYCEGTFPFGCAVSVPEKTKYGCRPNGGCHYVNNKNDAYPIPGFCTYQLANTSPVTSKPSVAISTPEPTKVPIREPSLAPAPQPIPNTNEPTSSTVSTPEPSRSQPITSKPTVTVKTTYAPVVKESVSPTPLFDVSQTPTMAITISPVLAPTSSLPPTKTPTATPTGEPTKSSTLGPTQPPSASPTRTPTLLPTPSSTPVTSLEATLKPSETPISNESTTAPVAAPTSSPIMPPTIASPSSLTPSTRQSELPSLRPTQSATTNTSRQSESPSVGNSSKDTVPVVSDTLRGLSITLNGITQPSTTRRRASEPETRRLEDDEILDDYAIGIFEIATATFLTQFYKNNPDLGVSIVSSNITVANQEPTESDGGVLVLYDHYLNYRTSSDISPKNVASGPFEAEGGTERYAEYLQQVGDASGSDAFNSLTGTSFGGELSSIVSDNQENPSNGSFWTTGVIVGVAVGSFAVLLLLVGGGIWYSNRRRKNQRSKFNATTIDNTTENNIPVSTLRIDDRLQDDISTLEDSSNHKINGSSNARFQVEQSLAASDDYDYRKAYDNGSNLSLTDGTNGDSSSSENGISVVAAKRFSAVGGSLESVSEEKESSMYHLDVDYKEIDVVVPAGKLGVIIDTPDANGPPVVHTVKDSSIVLGKFQIGDELCAIDDVDVRSMTALEVSKILSTKSSEARLIRIARRVPKT